MSVSEWTISRRDLERDKARRHVPPYWRPTTRGECADLPRPCPYMGCRYHLGLDVGRNGSLLFAHGATASLEALPATCALDVAARVPLAEGILGASQDEVGALLNIAGERVRQIEEVALGKLRDYAERHGLAPGDLALPELEDVPGPVSEDDLLSVLGFNTKEKTWLRKLSLSETQNGRRSQTSTTDLEWATL